MKSQLKLRSVNYHVMTSEGSENGIVDERNRGDGPNQPCSSLSLYHTVYLTFRPVALPSLGNLGLQIEFLASFLSESNHHQLSFSSSIQNSGSKPSSNNAHQHDHAPDSSVLESTRATIN